MEYFSIFYQSVFSILALFLLTKLMGAKQMSQLSMFDYINGITIGSIAAEMATDLEGNFLKPLLAMAIYALTVIVLAKIAQRFIPFRRIVNGKAILLYHNDSIYYENLKKAQMDINEFLMECRINGYFDLSEIETAILEANGKISFLPLSLHRPATPNDFGMVPESEELFANVIIDGKILDRNLQHVGKDRNWLNQQLDGQNIKKVSDVFLAVCDKSGHFQVYPKIKHIIDKDILG